MGDSVQVVLDRMVPDLEDLEERGIFSHDEVSMFFWLLLDDQT
jgi:U3 small nucleolar RNA-associated protein 6